MSETKNFVTHLDHHERVQAFESMQSTLLERLRDPSFGQVLGSRATELAVFAENICLPNVTHGLASLPKCVKADAIPVLPITRNEKIGWEAKTLSIIPTQIQNVATAIGSMHNNASMCYSEEDESILCEMFNKRISDHGSSSLHQEVEGLTRKAAIDFELPAGIEKDPTAVLPLIVYGRPVVEIHIDSSTPSDHILSHELTHAEDAITKPLFLQSNARQLYAASELRAYNTSAAYGTGLNGGKPDMQSIDTIIETLRQACASPHSDPYELNPALEAALQYEGVLEFVAGTA